MKLIINEIPPSNNKFQGTGNRYAYQNVKKYWAELIYFSVKSQVKDVKIIDKATVKIKYFFKDKIRRDPDNYSGKFILDGLVKSGVLKDDSFNNIDLILKADVDKDNPRTEISIIEVIGNIYENPDLLDVK